MSQESDDGKDKKEETAATPGEPEAAQQNHDAADAKQNNENTKSTVNLYKSKRLEGYFTLALTSLIHFNAAQKSADTFSGTAVPATKAQRSYAMAVSIVSVIFTTVIVIAQFDRFSPLRALWTKAFQPKSKVELGFAVFLCFWWTIATCIETAIGGIAGDGRQQYSLYFSSWACCITSYYILERWLVATGASSLKAFIASWPYRAPAWICVLFFSIMALIWYLNLWQNYPGLDQPQEEAIFNMLDSVSDGQWQWLIIIIVFTFCSALGFTMVELVRDLKPDGSNDGKTKLEDYIEGATWWVLALAWIPTVVLATAPGGAGSLVGNAYFSTWLLVAFVFEGSAWWIHDYRMELHKALIEKARLYKDRQRQVLLQALQQNEMNDENFSAHDNVHYNTCSEGEGDYTSDRDESSQHSLRSSRRGSSEYFDASDGADG